MIISLYIVLANAFKYLKQSNGDLQSAITNYLNSPSDIGDTCVEMDDCLPIPSSTDEPSCSYKDNMDNTSSFSECSSSSRSDSCLECSSRYLDISNNYCTLSLLVQLRILLLKRSNCAPLKTSKKDTKIVAGDGVFHIEKLLMKCFSYSETNASIIRQLCPDILPKNNDVAMVDVSTTLGVQEKAKKERSVEKF